MPPHQHLLAHEAACCIRLAALHLPLPETATAACLVPVSCSASSCPACSGPTILSVKATSPASGVACLEPPTQGGPWVKYSCAACYGGSCVTAPICTIDPIRRRSLAAQACASGQACNLPNLEASTSYT